MRDFSGNTGQFTISRVDPSGRRLVSFSTDGSIRAWNYVSGEEESLGHVEVSENGFTGFSANFSPDASLIGLGRVQPEIWDTRTETQVSVHSEPGHWAKRFAFSRDGNQVYVGGSGGLLTQLDTATGRETRRFAGHSGYVRDCHCSQRKTDRFR